MYPDHNFVRESFSRFNTLIFESSLPVPMFCLTRARTFRGKLVYKLRRTSLKTQAYDFQMRISLNFDLPVSEWEDVIIHEMIHLLIASKGIKDSSSHGPEFRRIMTSINRKFGRKIQISAKSNLDSRQPVSGDKRVKAHYICLAKFSDGRLGVAPVAKSKIFQMWDAFKAFPGVVSLKWIASTSIWFNSLPHIRSPKFYIIKLENLLPNLKGARPLQREGNVIKVVNLRCIPDELLP